MKKKLLLFVLLFCLSVLSASAQKKRVRNVSELSPPPGGIKLLNGYVHIPLRGIDTRVGRIKKEGGLDILYDIGPLAGEYVNRCLRDQSCVWYKEQQLKGGLVKIALASDGRIIATFPKTTANFSAEVKSQEDIADFLIMILTYDETQCCENNTTANNSLDVRARAATFLSRRPLNSSGLGGGFALVHLLFTKHLV